MYQGNLAAASNRTDWTLDAEITDPETDSLVDLTGATIVFYVTSEQQPEVAIISASTGSGITITGTGMFTISIPCAQMQKLGAGEHRVFLRATINGIQYQLLSANLPVVDGGPI